MATTPHHHAHIDERAVPGTVHLVDQDGTMTHSKHSAGQRDVVLIPTPSADPDDPLNWSPRRKALSTFCNFTYVLTCGIAGSTLYSILTQITAATGIGLDTLNAGTGYMFLLLGWGCLFWQTVALAWGKRLVYLTSLVGVIATLIWTAHIESSGQWLASKVIQGFFAAPIESLCEISVSDVYFAHERGFYMGAYAMMLFGSNFLAPIIAGFINDGQGWRWVLYWSAIIPAIGFVILFFFMEETNYYGRRSVEGQEVMEEVEDLSSRPITPPQATLRPPSTKDGIISSTPTDPEKSPINGISTPTSLSPEIETGQILQPPRKTYLQKLLLIDQQPHRPSRRPLALLTTMLRPVQLLYQLPPLLFAGFHYGLSLIMFNILNATASLILSGSPYHFAASAVGLAYLAPLVGVCVGAAIAGRGGDAIALAWARRHPRGLREPEAKLWVLGINVVLVPLGMVMWGVGAARGWHWMVVLVGMGIVGATNGVGATAACNYAVDCYRELAGEGMVSVILVRNTMGFAIGYGITPWVEGMGYRDCFITAAFVGMVCTASFLLMVRWGKKIRVRSRERYWAYVETSALGGH